MLTERVQLPSHGIPYGDRLPDGWMEIRPITTKEEKYLLSPTDRLNALNKILCDCVLTDTVAVEELLIADRQFLLLVLRNISYGKIYEFEMRCPRCREHFKKALKVPDDLVLTVFEEDDSAEGIEVKLPRCGQTVTLRLLRVKDENALLKKASGGFDQPGSDAYISRLAMHLTHVDGEEVKFSKAYAFVESMIGMDSSVFQKTLADKSCGVDLRMKFNCPVCQHEFDDVMPMSVEFFRPSNVQVPEAGDGDGDAPGDPGGTDVPVEVQPGGDHV